MKRSWLQLSVYAGSLVIGLLLDIYRPDVKGVLCTPLNLDEGLQNNGNIDPTSRHQPTPIFR